MEVDKPEMDQDNTQDKISRPTTPSMPIFEILPKNEDEWWRPSHPPETYVWEEIRRQRQQGGYPWTLLDKDDEIDADEYLDDNLYEPVNPPPLYETGSTNLRKDKVETGSLDGRKLGIEIPPEIEICNSEGLDGLDQPDRHDFGFDGDREWGHSDDERAHAKLFFTAGIRAGHDHGGDIDTESHHSSGARPLTSKSITFDPTVKDEDGEEVAEAHHQEVPRSSRSRSRSRSRSPSSLKDPKKTTTAFAILKSKAAGAADQVKQRFSKFALPIRPKLSPSEGAKMSRKKPKKKNAAAATEIEDIADQEVPEAEGGEPLAEDQEMATTAEEPMDIKVNSPEQNMDQSATTSKEAQAEELKKEKEAQAEEKRKKQKELEEQKKAKAEEKKREQEAQEELKKQKAEEKKREQEEIKRQKAEEKQRAKEEADKKKAEEKAAKQKAQEEAKKAKLEEQIAKAREAEEIERQKNEELLRLREQEEAAKAAIAEVAVVETVSSSADPEEDKIEVVEEEMEELPTTTTPTGTGSRRKKIKKTFVQLPQIPKLPDLPKLPHIDLDFKRKVIKRSKTPPARPTPPKSKLQKRGVEETENQLAAQYASEIEARKLELENDEEEQEQEAVAGHSSIVRFPDTPIFVTQPSIEPSEEAESQKDWRSFPRSVSNERSEPGRDDFKEEEKKPPAPTNKEKMDKFGQQLKGFGIKSKEMASKKSKAMGATMKVIGKDLQKFGVKTSEKFQATIEEIKAKQEAAKARSKEMKAKEAEDIEGEVEAVPYVESGTEPRRKFRFRRRDESQEEQDENSKTSVKYEQLEEDENQQGRDEKAEDEDGERKTRSQLLGRAERDWESPLDLAHSRDVSEEPFSGNASSRADSPPGSSMASSTFAHVRKQGVLEEIDSDEFFLREKGISEGEDEEEINRFLVEELRQHFRAQQDNALAGFDLPEPPNRPGRQPKKPPRREKGDKSPTYQTFPPERGHKTTPGYVSDYIKNQQEGDEELEQLHEAESYLNDGLKEEQSMEDEDDEAVDAHEDNQRDYVDDGRYEPISTEEPVKPSRKKKGKKPLDETNLYYNTVAGNEWMREVEEQVLQQQHQLAEENNTQKSGSNEKNDIAFFDEEDPSTLKSAEQTSPLSPEAGFEHDQSEQADDEDLEYVDEGGYAVVHKVEREIPKTIPRRKKRNGSKSNSLKRTQVDQQQPTSSTDNNPEFFSLPRQPPRTYHAAPPSRPQRTYSTLKPRRPPRHRSNSSLNRRRREEGRPSTAIGIMHGRPLPPPPRPQRSPVPPLNDLDQTTIERAVGARHYANFGDGPGVDEQICTATNVTVLGDINIGVQTDPVQEYDNEAAFVPSFEETRRAQKISDPHQQRTNATPDEHHRSQPREPSTGRDPRFGTQSPSELSYMFPRRLHLDELEVNVLRVNDLSASSITVEHLNAPQLEVNSLTSLGPLSVSSIHTQTLNSDQINCNRLSSDTVDLPTVVPPSFYNLASPQQPPCDEKPEELRHVPDKEEVICPYTPFEDNLELQYENVPNLKTDRPSEVVSPSEEFFMSGRNVEFCLTPEQSMENDDSWSHEDTQIKQLDVLQERTELNTSPSNLDEDIAHASDLRQESNDYSEDFSSLSPEQEEAQAKTTNNQQTETSPSSNNNTKFFERFKVAVLENQSSEESLEYPEEHEENLEMDAGVINGSLRLEYSRSPEVPSDFQVHHQIRDTLVERAPDPEIDEPKESTPIRIVHQVSASASQSSSSREASVVPAPGPDVGLEQQEVGVREDLGHMGMRFGRAVSRMAMRGLEAIIDYIDVATSDDPSKAEEQRAHMQVLLCLLLIFIAGIILSSNSNVTFSPPKWEFLMPPPHL